MARVNYNFEKRQKDLARRKKAEEKLQRRIEKNRNGGTDESPEGEIPEGDASETTEPAGDATPEA